jgi:hypothetical protein
LENFTRRAIEFAGRLASIRITGSIVVTGKMARPPPRVRGIIIAALFHVAELLLTSL